MIIPQEATLILQHFAPLFSQPTYQRFLVLVVAAILTPGRRTISNLLRTVGHLAHGHSSCYHRVLSAAQWSGLQAACILTRLLLLTFYRKGPIYLAGDDTVTEHRGKKVYGKGRHRDAVRSSHSYTAHRYGHKWIVVAVLIKRPWSWRWWACPLLVDLYTPPAVSQEMGRRHRTPAERMARLLRLLMRWFPDRQWLFAGDSGFGGHEMARLANKHQPRLTLVSRFWATANLYEAPPPKVPGKRGPAPKKGAKLPSPAEVVAQTVERQRLRVWWYGGGKRTVEIVTGTGWWYKAGEGVVQVRWVYVHDVSGEHRDDYLYSTNVSLTAKQIIESYTRRWNLETTFQELRAYLGLESTCGRKRETIWRAEPCLFGLYSLVVLLYEVMPAEHKGGYAIAWSGKESQTFSDVLTAVRRWLWVSCIFTTAGQEQTFSQLPAEFQEILLRALAPAA